jgi:alginate O-acetyltransferase complex protein AlgI
MTLSDPGYLAFLAFIFVFFYNLRCGGPRLMLLLTAGYFFYFWLSGIGILILLLDTVIVYVGGMALVSEAAKKYQGWCFLIFVGILLAPLIIFKYLEFILQIGASALAGINYQVDAPMLHLALPIGISFFTFVALGYLYDIYLEITEPERNPGRLAVFLSFFPLISAGPIERSEGLLPQLGLGVRFEARGALAGLKQIFWGLVLKLLFADMLSVKADLIFNSPGKYMPLEEFFGVIFFMFYLYADFAGYTLIALGSARVLGLEVIPNFNQPFLSTSVPDFWRNWHISLSSWVRDYIFVPLSTRWRERGTWGLISAIMLSFTLIGVWHGAGWNFFAFGVIQGLLVVGSIQTLAWRDRFWADLHIPSRVVRIERIVVTFVVVALSFVPFRARTPADALLLYSDIFSRTLASEVRQSIRFAVFGHGHPMIMSAISWTDPGWLLIAAIVVGDVLARYRVTLDRFPLLLQLIVYNIGVDLVAYRWISVSSSAPFLYYKF